MAFQEELRAHLATGATTVCRVWAVRRRDGVRFGFTDHDSDLVFDGQLFRAETGVSGSAIQQNTGLSVDNSEAFGALSDEGLSEADILSGRFDGAEVTGWLVNWRDVSQRSVTFRGTIGEIRRGGGAFHAELRGLSERLNIPLGRVYQKPCSALLGDVKCRVDLSLPANYAEGAITEASEGRIFSLPASAHATGWFERGRLQVLTGEGAGLTGLIKADRITASGRKVELWQSLNVGIAEGSILRIEAGCDKRVETCREKFGNLANYRGFPSIPGEDWLIAYPSRRLRR